jgi:N-acetyl-gamma-glutamyl-phosphate reductase
VTVVGEAPATRHVAGSNDARIFVRLDERTGRILAIGVIDNLVKGAAGQAVQNANLMLSLDETTGLPGEPAWL